MYFGSVVVEESVGCILAHSHKSPAGKIRKGQILTTEHVELLQASGVEHVSIARLDNSDLHEDEAALQIALELAGKNTRLGSASTGRVNIHATESGLCDIAAATIQAINTLDESITVATLAESTRVTDGQIIATVKIIPFATQVDLVQTAISVAANGVSVLPLIPSKAYLIQTQLPAISSKALDKARQVTEHRLIDRGCHLVDEQRVPHTQEAVMIQLSKVLTTDVDWILIFGASAISDRADVIPAAITSAGGTIERFGMPVDPGNLLLFARVGNKIIIGMPGCARSPKYNGLDRVLDRMATRTPVTDQWISSLGVGGLLSEIPDRPRPRVMAKEQPKITALVLAAGTSRRFGERNKLLSIWLGKSLVQHVVSAAVESNAAIVTVVTGFEQPAIEASIRNINATKPIEFIHNDAFSTGMASSLVKGVSASLDADATIVCLADMPRISSDVINQLIEAFQRQPDKAIYFPIVNGQRGNPVLVARRLFDSMLSLTGDTGARVLAQQFPDSVSEVQVNDNSILHDVDTENALTKLQQAPDE